LGRYRNKRGMKNTRGEVEGKELIRNTLERGGKTGSRSENLGERGEGGDLFSPTNKRRKKMKEMGVPLYGEEELDVPTPKA